MSMKKPENFFECHLFAIPMYDCYLVKDYYVGSNGIALSAYSFANGYIGDLTQDRPGLEDGEVCLTDCDWAYEITRMLKLGEDTGRKTYDGLSIYTVNADSVGRYAMSIKDQVEHQMEVIKAFEQREQEREEAAKAAKERQKQ